MKVEFAREPVSNPWRRYGALVIGLVCLGLALLGYAMYALREQTERAALAGADIVVTSLERSLDASFRRVDAALGAFTGARVGNALRDGLTPALRDDMARTLGQQAHNFPEVSAFSIIDRDGNSLVASASLPSRSVADREWFKRLVAEPHQPLHFSEVLQGRATGQRVMIVAKPILDANGRLGGAALAGLNLEQLRQSLTKVDLGPNGIVAIRRKPGAQLVARWPEQSGSLNQPLNSDAYWRSLEGARSGQAVGTSPVDGIERRYVFRSAGAFPFVVIAGIAPEDYFAAWRRTAWFSALAAILGLTGVAISLRGAIQGSRRELESLERFRQLTQLSSDWIWEQDAECRFTYSSALDNAGTANVAQLLKTIIGKRRWEVESVVPLNTTWDAHRAVLGARLPFRDFEYRQTTHDGSYMYVSTSGEPLFGVDGKFAGYRGTGRDITSLRQASEAVRESAERFEGAFEYSAVGIGLVDLDGRWFRLNEALARTLGYSREELLKMRFQDVTHPDDLAANLLNAERLKAGQIPFFRMEKRYLHRDGHFVPVEATVALVRDAQGQPLYTVAQIQDVSERREMQEALRRANEELESRIASRTAALSVANQELEAFSYSVAHDLKAPLRAIAGYSRLLMLDESARLSEDGRTSLEAVEQNALQLARLVDDLLELARISRADLALRRLDVGDIVRGMAGELARRFPSARLTVAPMPQAYGDITLITQVFHNLVGNAFKYSSKVDTPQIEVGWSEAHAAWFVRDNGAGFDMRFADKLFGTFQRLHALEQFPGTGVGLSIVKRIVGRHGGSVWADSTPGEGATFYLRLPGPSPA